MDNKSATTAEAAPAVIKAGTPLEEGMNENNTSDVMEILQGLVDRLQQIEAKVDHRLHQIEEKLDHCL